MSDPKKEAARVLETLRAAIEITQATPSVEAEEVERKRFDQLVTRAARAGHSLVRVPSGFMLVRASGSYHCSGLDGIAAILTQREGGDT